MHVATKTKQAEYDAIVIGSGPGGQNAAITAAGYGARTLIIERQVEVGGACVQFGTIPSKTLRETALTLSAMRRRSGGVIKTTCDENLRIHSMMNRLQQVVEAHQSTTRRYLDHANVETVCGQAEFLSPNELVIKTASGEQITVAGKRIFIATGSQPRNPAEIPVDHETIMDSDSILSMNYLPRSLTIIGGGVIASEYASTFASLGVKVTMIDRYPSPLGFMDAELVQGFVDRFESNGGVFLGNRNITSMQFDGISQVLTKLDDDTEISSDKALVALGRVANTKKLSLDKAGLAVTDRGLVEVDENYQTTVESIYAVGDAIGPPSLASTSLHQGRLAANHAFGSTQGHLQSVSPMGIYTIPEIASVGKDEKLATESHGQISIGRAKLSDLARGQIMAESGGLLKIVADADGQEILGVQIVGEGATELVHIGQLAIRSKMSIDELAMTNFNFPTLAEAYRVAALDLIAKRQNSTLPRTTAPLAAVASS